jgi:hypothetical protein
LVSIKNIHPAGSDQCHCLSNWFYYSLKTQRACPGFWGKLKSLILHSSYITVRGSPSRRKVKAKVDGLTSLQRCPHLINLTWLPNSPVRLHMGTD